LHLKKDIKLNLAFVLASNATGKQRSRIRTVNMDGKEVYELVTILCEESIYRYARLIFWCSVLISFSFCLSFSFFLSLFLSFFILYLFLYLFLCLFHCRE
jgi:hypothetical protein